MRHFLIEKLFIKLAGSIGFSFNSSYSAKQDLLYLKESNILSVNQAAILTHLEMRFILKAR